EPGNSDEARDGEANRAPKRVSSADPIPKAKHVSRVDTELRDLGGGGRDGGEVLRDGRLALQSIDQPRARASRVHQRFLRGEGLRCDDEESRLGVEVL